jgi:hypothetical protein
MLRRPALAHVRQGIHQFDAALPCADAEEAVMCDASVEWMRGRDVGV